MNHDHKILIDDIFCPICKSKKICVYEEFIGLNSYLIDENGVISSVTENCQVHFEPKKIKFRCALCLHRFRKKGITLITQILKK